MAIYDLANSVPQGAGGSSPHLPQGGGDGELFRGSSEIPLTPDGIRSAVAMSINLAQKGGLDEIQTSDLGRTVHTARILSHYTHAPITYIGNGPHPWHLGYLEGQPVTPEHLALQNHLITENPDEALPGRGPVSTSDGESFNSFRDRALNYWKGLISKAASDPERKIGVVTHYRTKRVLDAWMRNGAPQDNSIDSQTMVTKDESSRPGSIERLSVDPNAGAQIHRVDPESPEQQLLGGIYILRHERTPWNSSPGSTPSVSPTS